MRIAFNRVTIGFTGIASFALVALVARPAPADGDLTSLKANLDLPYNAGGHSDDEEVAPEVVYFFGASYEADAVVFALDSSGSMRNESRWALQTREVVRALTQLTKAAEFGLLYFSSGVTAFRDSPEHADFPQKAAAAAFIHGRQPNGDTCLFEGLMKALSIARKSSSKARSVILTSDGRPDVCSTGERATPQQIEMLIQQSVAANPGLAIKVHTIWVGSGSDSAAIEFMKRVAATHGGTFRQVSR